MARVKKVHKNHSLCFHRGSDLPKGDSAVVGGNVAMPVGVETFLVQALDCSFAQIAVLKATPG